MNPKTMQRIARWAMVVICLLMLAMAAAPFALAEPAPMPDEVEFDGLLRCGTLRGSGDIRINFLGYILKMPIVCGQDA